MTVLQQIKNVYQLLGDNRLEKLGLLSFENEAVATPLMTDVRSLFTHRSKRADELIQQSVIERLIAALRAGKGYKGINHIGFCYKVDSKESEVKRITQVASSKGLSVYREPSIDDAAWVFVGDISVITNPLLEFLPIEGPINDKWVEYWLPHVQIDIDTGLSPDEIKTIVRGLIDRPFTPYPIKIDGVTCIQRVNLGCLEGVNLILDMSTSNRDINSRNSWTKLA